VFRVLQEALNNVARHSGAKQAWVRLRFAADHLQLEIEDHGSGFSANGARQGIGLVAMRERAELLGGKIGIERPAAGGTLVRMTVPKEQLESNA
jgi:signal transduction histidine kinase